MNENYERIGELVAEGFHYDGGVGSKQITLFRCTLCSGAVDSEHLDDHTGWHAALDQILNSKQSSSVPTFPLVKDK